MSAMKLRGSLSGVLLCLALLPCACGGGAKPAEAPEAKADEKPAESGAADKAEKPDAAKADENKPDAAKPDAKPDAAKPAAPADDGPKATRTPTDILTAPHVIFLFSFNDSEPKAAADAKCSKKAGGNAKKMNECMAAERKNFPADGYRFKKDDKGQWWWITVRQNGNRLVALHKIPVELGEETTSSVTLKPVGKDKGSGPIVFEVPNDYQIAVKDPKAGRLVFLAKVDVVTE
jgi:hypothetical protein